MLRQAQATSLRARQRWQVNCRATLARTPMGRRRRKYKNIQRLYQQNVSQQQQEQQLDDEETRLLSKQLWVTCLTRDATEGTVKAEFSRLYGGVQQVRLHNKNTGSPGDVLLQNSNFSLNGRQQQQRGPLPRAVVEFADAQSANNVLNARQNVAIFSGRNGQRTSQVQLVLPAGSVGHLKQPCDCRRHRIPCKCLGYVKAERNRPTPNQSYHRGGAGEHTLEALHLQIGSVGDGGQPLRPEYDSEASCNITVDLQQRCIIVTTTLSGSIKYLLVSQFRHLRRSLAVNQQDRSLTFTLRQPPKILRALGSCSSCGRPLDLISDEGPVYELCGDPTASSTFGVSGSQCMACITEEVMGATRAATATSAGVSGVVGAGIAGADGLLGRCLTYKLRLHGSAVDVLFSDNNKLLKKLRSFKLLQLARQQTRQQSTVLSSMRAIHCPGGQSEAPTELSKMLQQLDFYVGYHVLVLLSEGVATPWQVTTGPFREMLQRAALESVDMTCKALAELSALRMHIKDLADAFIDQLSGIKQEATLTADKPTVVAAAQYKVLRVHVTPTRVRFLLPEVQTGNRVVRHFCAPTAGSRNYSGNLRCLNHLQFSTGHFLRVSFGDEHGDRLFAGRQESLVPFYQRMMYVLQTGVLVNGRLYVFLAYSSSQLKTCSTWMVADPHQSFANAAGAGVIADALRHWLGDAMETEHVPAKCAARLGQGFSATVDAAEVQSHQVSKILDIERVGPYSGDMYCFSDGVGRISPELLEKVLEALPFVPSDRPQISAIQVRFRGCKGVFSRYSPLPGRQLQLRPSMEKFGSDHPQLEVCSVAAWLPAYLNRQVIIMMNYNGVPTEVFLSKLESLLDQLACMCCSAEAALELLPSLGGVEPGAQDALLRLLDMSVTCGLPLDPLAGSCLKAIARWQVTDLRQKARLLVPDAVTLVGVMDEFGVLDEGEVFVQVQPPNRGLHTPQPRRVITGPVLLAKHPVAHRGDVRRVQAIDPSSRPGGQQLVDDYVNVAVFSQKGSRPLPNQLSGSDLDGDQYMVLWDEDLLQPRNSEPMDYTAAAPDRVERVKVSHLQQHFVNFAKNDKLGQVSTWLLAHADAEGADCPACDKLARLHSQAVDFPKTGRPATISPGQLSELIPVAYPHWMEKQGRPTYESTTVLGQIYDRTMEHLITKHLLGDESRAENSSMNSTTVNSRPRNDHRTAGQRREYSSTFSWPGRLLLVPGITPAYKQHVQQAEVRFIEFESDMVGLMNHWEVYDVGATLTGCLPEFQRRQGQHHQQSEKRDQINRELQVLFTRARSRFLTDLLLMSGRDQGTEVLDTLTIKALDSLVDERVKTSILTGDSSFGDSIRLQYAAAYMVVAYRREIHPAKQQQRSTAGATASRQHLHAESLGLPADSDDDGQGESDVNESASDNDNFDDDAEDDGWAADAQQEQQGTKQEQEVKRLLRLSFQWVVAKELQVLAWAV